VAGALTGGLRLLARLPAFLRRPVSTAAASAALTGRLSGRAEALADVLVRAAMANGPYRALLEAAGMRADRVRGWIAEAGVEATLLELWRRGVYLTVEELTGRRPIRRGGALRAPEPAAPDAGGGSAWTTSSGSRGQPRLVPVSLVFLAERATDDRLFLEARGGLAWEHAVWEAPGGALLTILRYARCGLPPRRWFSPIDPRAPGLGARYRWSEAPLRLGGRLAGVPLPALEVAPVEEPRPVLAWMRDVLQRGRTPHLDTFVTPALRLVHEARARGVDLTGAHFTVVGEPLTSTRRAAIEASGASVVPTYRTAEAGSIGYGCLAPLAPDEVHLAHDLVAVLASPDSDGREVAQPLWVTSLRRHAPMLLLNAALGDEGVITPRACHCPLERLGWRTHLHTIRGIDKLTAGGTTFLDTDLIRILDELLPARFGGGPTHYQLVEEEGHDGAPRVRLLVHPDVGAVDAEAVREAFLEAIGGGRPAHRIMSLQWRASGLPRVERRPPFVGRTGKVLHLHQSRGAPPPGPAG
jgi:hypothetical protein